MMKFKMISIIGLTLLLISCKRKSPEYTGPIQNVTIAVEASVLGTPIWVAREKGFFNKHGIKITIKEFNSGKESLLNMLKENENTDICTVASTPFVLNSFTRHDFCIFATYVSSSKDNKIIARKDRKITEAADLKNKKIGTTMRTSGQYIIEKYLIYHSVPPNEVKLMDFAPSELPSAINSGSVDAIIAWEPHASIAIKQLGENAVRLPTTEICKVLFNLVTMKEFAEKNPELLERFLKSVDEAIIFLKDNPAETQTITANNLKQEKEKIISHWHEFDFELSIDISLLTSLENISRWAIRNRFTEAEEIPNYLDYIHFDALQSVKSTAISIEH